MKNDSPCPRCGRTTMLWPLRRPGACAPKTWDFCLRDPALGDAQARRAAVKASLRGMEG